MNMERLGTLLEKLQQQYQQNASPSELLLTLQMMQQEIASLNPAVSGQITGQSVVLSMPAAPLPGALPTPVSEAPTPVAENKEEEKVLLELQLDESEIEAELDELKKNAEAIQQISLSGRPQTLFDFVEDDIPTLPPRPASPKEVNDSVQEEKPSLNDKLKTPQKEVSETLNEQTIKDLKKGIDVNERFLYINELFRSDETMYERSIKTINSFSIWPEAEYWISRELKIKLGWDDKHPVVQQFYQLVRRRFSAI